LKGFTPRATGCSGEPTAVVHSFVSIFEYHFPPAGPDSKSKKPPFHSRIWSWAFERVEGRPVVEDEAAAALHLPLEDLHPVADVERVVFGFVVAAAGRHEDRVGVVERRGIGGPAVEVGLDAHALETGDVSMQWRRRMMLRSYSWVSLGCESSGTGDEDDLLRAGVRLIGHAAQEQRQRRENNHLASR
jgi:hypothetical protein